MTAPTRSRTDTEAGAAPAHAAPDGRRTAIATPDDTAAQLRRGAVLVLGAVAIALLVTPIGPGDYYWNPFIAGVAFTLAAVVSGKGSPLWGAGLVVGFWGLSKVITSNVDFSWSFSFPTMMIGLGGLAAAYLGTRGFAMSAASVAWPVLFIGVGQYVHGTFKGYPITAYTAGLVALYGVVEIATALYRRRSATPAGV